MKTRRTLCPTPASCFASSFPAFVNRHPAPGDLPVAGHDG